MENSSTHAKVIDNEVEADTKTAVGTETKAFGQRKRAPKGGCISEYLRPSAIHESGLIKIQRVVVVESDVEVRHLRAKDALRPGGNV